MTIIVARGLLGGAFLIAGLRNARSIPALTAVLDAQGVPFARVCAIIGVGTQIVCGAALATGLLVPYAAAGLALFVLLATLIVHRYWTYEGDERFAHVNAFISNTALFGAFVLAMGTAL
ncbi:DoxX family protein [Pelagibacterium xiamenense]|uniref:DoxX family protein n=1 Tax=Pelagibacterium xiamenense TaxID=2901140 RepID=UPI001E5DDEF0|nr:DoxX family protein [Pelagibacterium xiamenense]MCD7060386.1 DoxX family protein [Pelagibacterium xiamenense]